MPRKMTSNMLDALKGWPRPNALDFNATLSANVTVSPVHAGTVVHVNSTGQYELGVSGSVMPLFIWQNSDDFDVMNDGGDPATDDDLPWVGTSPTGEIMALVAVGAYELWSTQYNTEEEYPPNTLLTAEADNADASVGGVLTPGTLGSNNICGVVSRGLISRWNKNVLCFWPVWMPAGV